MSAASLATDLSADSQTDPSPASSHARFFLVLAAISFLAAPHLLSQQTRLRRILGDSQ